MKKVIAGFLISALLIFLSFKGTDFQGVMAGLAKIGYVYILPFLVISSLMQLIRTWRWGLILRPLGKVGYLTLFSVTNVGFLAIIALPARLGELGRPYLLSRNSSIKMSAAIGTVLVERIFDGVAILTIASILPFFAVLPKWLIKANFIFFIINVTMISGIFIAVFRRDGLWKFLNYFLRLLPEAWQKTLDRLFAHFLD
ncbi:MAG: flippase-like domain-containing protein, partial [Syntrophales bacterium LBB04]|nr:flippase-like domain-containing protein [Syntrophales bacterium LBB04]